MNYANYGSKNRYSFPDLSYRMGRMVSFTTAVLFLISQGAFSQDAEPGPYDTEWTRPVGLKTWGEYVELALPVPHECAPDKYHYRTYPDSANYDAKVKSMLVAFENVWSVQINYECREDRAAEIVGIRISPN